jgi:NAD-dependent SIR2 family protein deacetylase
MVHDEFINHQVKRSRYWARSMLGYHRFSEARPNEGHRALASLEKDLGMLGLLISQNVDVCICNLWLWGKGGEGSFN